MTTAIRSEVPVVFVHNGPSQVIVTACVAQAKAAGCKRIIVISDSIGPWRVIPGVEHFAYSNAEAFGLREFSAVFANYSSYPDGYVASVFGRLFAMRALFEMHSLDRILHLDSDVLLFRPVKELADEYPCDFTGAECSDDNHETVSPHFMFLTPQVCNAVCADLLATYSSQEGHERLKELWRKKKEIDPAWGVSEMDFLAFCRDSGDFKFVRVNEGNPRVDGAIGSPEGFVCENGIKKVSFENGLPYGLLEANGERNLFNALHLQGYSKHLVIHYAQLNRFYKKALYGLWALERRGLLKWPKARRPRNMNTSA